MSEPATHVLSREILYLDKRRLKLINLILSLSMWKFLKKKITHQSHIKYYVNHRRDIANNSSGKAMQPLCEGKVRYWLNWAC
jgi:hypothetical protein